MAMAAWNKRRHCGGLYLFTMNENPMKATFRIAGPSLVGESAATVGNGTAFLYNIYNNILQYAF